MSENSGPEFDLEKLFLPSWAQGATTSANRYADFKGEPEPRRDDRRGPGGPRGPRRDGPAPFGQQRRGPGGGPGGFAGPGGGPGAPGGARGFGGRPQRRDDRGPRRDQDVRREVRPAPEPLPEVDLRFLPDEKGVESMAVQIRRSGRAYPLFEIAHMILEKPERHAVVFSVKKNAEGQPVQPLYLCALDDTLWLNEAEAVAHILEKHFATFYQAERTQTEPPKGTYTFVGQCGISGVILGPPNHHDYQVRLRALHTERFARMPFEMFKSRVKIVRDEAVVKKWIDDQSWKTEYVALNVPETLRFATREEVEKHFREVHLANIVGPVEKHRVPGAVARSLPCHALRRLVRVMGEDQLRFPLQLATTLSQIFAGHGLQFFKINKTVTHVAVARPRHLDLEATLVSDGVKRIVQFIDAHRKCTRRDLVEALAPTPAPPAAAPDATAAVESAAPTAEQMVVISDLHWLIHEGHVMEFHDGRLETAKRPVPRPQKPERKPAPGAKPAVEAEPKAETPAGEAPSSADLASEAAAHAEAVDAAETGGEVSRPEPAPSPAAPAVVAPAPAAPVTAPEPVAVVTEASAPTEPAPAPEAAKPEAPAV